MTRVRIGSFPRQHQRGSALVLMVVLGISLMVVSAVSLEMSLAHARTERTQRAVFAARQIAESGAAQALAKIKEGGLVTPFSGSGGTPAWVSFSGGNFYYSTSFNPVTEVSIIRAWGRVPFGPNPATNTVAPDSTVWDDTGGVARGVELTVASLAYIPEFPLYFGNGAVERPMGGFEWDGGTDLAKQSIRGRVKGSGSSYQSNSVPFEASALDHPPNYLYENNLDPLPAMANPHPYQIWTTQNTIGQHNVESWFTGSAGGADPTSKLSPPPNGGNYVMDPPSNPDYPYPVLSEIPDVQDFAWALWNKYKDSGATTLLDSGSHVGTFGDIGNPGVTFVTGDLIVDAGQTFEGAGVLVIRDAYDPNVDKDNRPDRKADMQIKGTLNWTGLVIVAGWAPTIETLPGSKTTIVGSLFDEDSVQSGGEISLDGATIILNIEGSIRALYSNALFREGGIVRQFLPGVRKEIIGIHDLTTYKATVVTN